MIPWWAIVLCIVGGGLIGFLLWLVEYAGSHSSDWMTKYPPS